MKKVREERKEAKMERVDHPFGGLYREDSEILILGSFPSVKSREASFFYGHPRNRFWPMLARIFEEEEAGDIEARKELAIRHKIALWDVIASCEIRGSADSSIRNVVANDLRDILRQTQIKKIICNGKTAGDFYQRYTYPSTKIEGIVLPSTSPANAAYSLEALVKAWSGILKDKGESDDI